MEGRLEPEAFEVHGARRRSPGGAAAAEAEVVEAQVQAGAGSHLEEAQGQARGLRGLEQAEDEPGRAAHLVRLAGQGHEGAHGLGVVERSRSCSAAQAASGSMATSGAGRGTRARQLQGQRRGAPFESQAVAGGEKAEAQGVAARARSGVGLEQGEAWLRPPRRPRAARSSRAGVQAASPWRRTDAPGRGAGRRRARGRARATVLPLQEHVALRGLQQRCGVPDAERRPRRSAWARPDRRRARPPGRRPARRKGPRRRLA